MAASQPYLIKKLLEKIKKNNQINYRGQEIKFTIPWEKISFRDLIKKHAGIDIENISEKELQRKLKELKNKNEKK